MGLVGDLLLWLTRFAQDTLAASGYLGLFLLMAAESMVFPVPSEAVMPFAGALIQQGRFSWLGAILASSAGSLFGSWLSYLLGRFGFLPFLERYGKYVFVQPHHITKANAFFARRGVVAVFICRFIPGVRHVSSIPAGSARMPLLPFLAASVLGATIWNTFLLYIGYRFAGNEAAIAAVKGNLDIVGIALLLVLVGYVFYEVRKGKASRAQPPPPPPPPN
ncbi:MAG TPA: DedA family protein [Candidatus Thermoplasmatota archaeon]|nr:DedA family protein [Candidatus Thermoplasmatota archaeon]